MKIEYEIAGGHRRGDLDNFIIANPAMNKEQAQRCWIEERFGGWIKNNVSEDYDIYEITELGFRVEFTKDADALTFIRTLGGRSLGEE